MLLTGVGYFISWAVGAVILFFWLKNKNNTLRFSDVIVTAILSGGVGVVFAFAATHARLENWGFYVLTAIVSFIVSHKFLDKK